MESELQDAIRSRRMVAFDVGPRRWNVEPHMLIRRPGGALCLIGWSHGRDGTGTWLQFDLADMAELRLVPAIFAGTRAAQSAPSSDWDILCSTAA